jgi:hypothetical protein
VFKKKAIALKPIVLVSVLYNILMEPYEEWRHFLSLGIKREQPLVQDDSRKEREEEVESAPSHIPSFKLSFFQL